MSGFVERSWREIEPNNKDYARGFEAGRDSVLRKNESGCCCKIDEDGETILELCAAHRLHLDIQLGEQKVHLLAQTIEVIKKALWSL